MYMKTAISRRPCLTTKILAFGLLFIHISAFSQKKTANFTVTDAFGISHDLYDDYLDKGKTVVIDLFFTDCPPCNSIAPFIKASYEKWGSGNENVQFISLSPIDNNLQLLNFHDVHRLIHPSSGIEGGGDKALEQYTNDFFGKFLGYPVLLLIKPNREVIYDIYSTRGDKETIELLDFHIAASLVGEISQLQQLFIPNPSIGPGNYQVSVLDDSEIEIMIYDMGGRTHVKHKEIIKNNGVYVYNHLIQNLVPGQYIAMLKEQDEIKSIVKFIIL